MSSTMKKVLIGAVILVGIGLILNFAALAMVDFNIDELRGSGKYDEMMVTETVTYSYGDGGVKDIELTAPYSYIEIRETEGDEIKFTYPSYFYAPDVRDGNLSLLTQKSSNNFKHEWYNILNDYSFSYPNIILELPKNFRGKVDINAEYAGLGVSDITTSNLYIQTNSGDVSVSNVESIGACEIINDYGKTTLRNLKVAEQVSLEAEYGILSIEEMTSGGDLEVRGNSGLIKIRNIVSRNINLENSYGEINLNNVVANESLYTSSEYGNLAIRDIAAKRIEFYSKSGAIRGTIAGTEAEYRISSNTAYGSSNLKSKFEGEKELYVENEYGNVDIRFSK